MDQTYLSMQTISDSISTLDSTPYTEPLNHDLQEIRVASLLPGKWDDPISCRLSTISLDDPNAPYEALSYVWAQEPGTREILLNGSKHQITTNLFYALRRLRKANDVRVIWVDALCINQGNDAEKSHQVGIMGDVYRKCQRGVIWLGDYVNDHESVRDRMTVDETIDLPWAGGTPGPDTDTLDKGYVAFQIIHEFSKDKHIGDIDILSRPGLDAIVSALTSLPWWFRIWVVQETALPKDCIVTYGSVHAPWSIFSFALFYLYNHSTTCCSWEFGQLSQELRIGLENFTHIVSELDRTRRMVKGGESMPPFYKILRRYRINKATDPRDMIYALLGFSTEVEAANFLQADYSLEIQEVYKGVSTWYIENFGKLHILFGQRSPKQDISAWLYDWSAPVDQSSWGWEYSRLAISDLYTASSAQKAVCTVLENSNLSVDGMRIGSVLSIGEFMPNHRNMPEASVVIKSWHKMAKDSHCDPTTGQSNKEYVSGETWNNAFWRTITGDLAPPEGSKTPRERGTADLKDCFTEWWFNVLSKNWNEIYHNSALRNFEYLVTLSSRSRTFFLTDNGYMGLGCPQIGDEVWVLFGGELPFMLRPDPEASTYATIGDCYVQGIMDGEAMVDLEEKRQTIVLR